MSQATMSRKVHELVQELQDHPHYEEIITLMYEQLEDDM